MTRTELINTANELGLTFDKPTVQTKSIEIETAIKNFKAAERLSIDEEMLDQEVPTKFEPVEALLEEADENMTENVVTEPVVEVKKVKIYEKILQLGSTGTLTKTEIYNQLKVEHQNLNYRYVVQTLLKAKVTVPRQVRVFTSTKTKEQLQEQIDKLQAQMNNLVPAVE